MKGVMICNEDDAKVNVINSEVQLSLACEEKDYRMWATDANHVKVKTVMRAMPQRNVTVILCMEAAPLRQVGQL